MHQNSSQDVHRAISALRSLDPGMSGDEWRDIMFAAHDAGISVEDFDAWSSPADNYKGSADVRSRWKSVKPGGGVTEKTLFSKALEHGWTDPANDNCLKKVRSPVQDHWNSGKPAPADHPYIVRKGGKPDGLRIVTWDLQGWAALKGKNLKGWLMVPSIDARGEIVSIQFIGQNGDKLNAGGASISAGTFTVGTLQKGQTAYIVEGIGHAWSLNAVSGCAAVVAFGVGNIERAAQAAKKSGALPVIVPDRGKETKATEIALSNGCAYALLPDDMPDGADVNDLHAERGADAVRAILDKTRQTLTNNRQFQFLNVGDMVQHLKPIDWLVKGYVERDSMAVIYGEPGHGKSFVAIDMACSVATGTAWHGHNVKRGAVFYIAGEGHNGLARRFRAWSENTGVLLTSAPLYVSNRSTALTDGVSAAAVADAVQELAQATGETPSLIVVDTLARNFGSADENSAADMGAFVTNLDNNLRTPWKATVAIVHHSGKDATKGARGSTALRGAVDAEYEITKDDTGTVRMQPHKMKDAENPEPLAFKLQSVELPLLDEDGRRVFGAALQVVDYVEPPKAGKIGRGKNQTAALQALHELDQEQRDRLERSGNNPDNSRVSLQDWRDRVVRDLGIDRRRFYDLRDSLSDAGKIIIEDGQYVRAI